MANYGIGIGGFMSGLADGAQIADAMQRRDSNEARQKELLELEKQRFQKSINDTRFDQGIRSRAADIAERGDQRAAETHATNQKLLAESLAESTAKRQREADIAGIYRSGGEEAQRTYGQRLGKSIMQDTATYGPNRDGFRVNNEGPTFATRDEAMPEAKRQLTFAESYAQTAGKQIYDNFIARGYTKEAEGFRQFIDSEKTKNNLNRINEAGKLAQVGDYDGALRAIRPVINDESYNPDGRTYGFEVVRDADGNAVGIEGWGKDSKTGKVERQRFDNAQTLFSALVPLVNPVASYLKLAEKENQAPDFQVIGETEQGKQYGFVDRARRTVTPVETGAGQAERNPYATGKFNEGQGKAATYGDRMAASHAVISDLEGINSGLEGAVGGIAQNNLPAGVANMVSGPERQRFEQAKRDFVNAVLRRESGAAISQSEFDNANRQYFPQPGDSPDVIAQKRANRITSTQGIMREAGPAYRPPAGWSGPQAQQQATQQPRQPAAQAAPQPQPRQAPQPQQIQAQQAQPQQQPSVQVAPQRRVIPAGAVDMLRSDPSLAGFFDQKYGAGSAASILGAQ